MKKVLSVLSKNEDIPTALLVSVTEVHVSLNVPLVYEEPVSYTHLTLPTR